MKKSGLLLLLFLHFIAISSQNRDVAALKVGADRLEVLLPLLKDKKVALVINQTSCLSNGVHLLDTLWANGVSITRIFAPEHGFRGDAGAGETIVDGKDRETGISILSLYGNNKKPARSQLSDVDVVVFDIQDVGARFYTYISTMHYVMEACAENGKECIVLDRPNPNDYIDGPVLDPQYKSFVGMHPIPALHGLTVGELAQMINGEKWLKNRVTCRLTVISVTGWTHGKSFYPPIKPSPNLPTDQSVMLYPSLCFFEATTISIGRGTHFPFQVIGFPNPKFGSFTFTPESLPGFDRNPLQKGKLCYGIDLREAKVERGLSLKYLIDFYKKAGRTPSFFKSPDFMDKLAGTNKLREQIIKGMDEKTIRATWKKDLNNYKTMRKKYLLYPDNVSE
ncbi:exo-beta-N-acetylmuramidase NamZ family protein [Viscerimonas tarda]